MTVLHFFQSAAVGFLMAVLHFFLMQFRSMVS